MEGVEGGGVAGPSSSSEIALPPFWGLRPTRSMGLLAKLRAHLEHLECSHQPHIQGRPGG